MAGTQPATVATPGVADGVYMGFDTANSSGAGIGTHSFIESVSNGVGTVYEAGSNAYGALVEQSYGSAIDFNNGSYATIPQPQGQSVAQFQNGLAQEYGTYASYVGGDIPAYSSSSDCNTFSFSMLAQLGVSSNDLTTAASIAPDGGVFGLAGYDDGLASFVSGTATHYNH